MGQLTGQSELPRPIPLNQTSDVHLGFYFDKVGD